MKTLLVFGASRGVGRHAVEQALAEGRRVVALLRKPETQAELTALGAEVVPGDALNLAAGEAACHQAGTDAEVLSTLGSFGADQPVDYLGNRHVADAMATCGLRRLLLVTSLGCGDSWPTLSPRSRAAFGGSVREKTLAEAWLMTSSLDYTIVRPGGLRNGPALGNGQLSQHQEVHGFVRRADVAATALSLLAKPDSIGQIYALIDPNCPPN